MKICVVGTGYVGLVTGTCFADSGNDVICVDIDERKVAALKNGEVPIFEPGLSELVVRNAQSGRLQFTTDLASSVAQAQIVYLAVGTPQSEDGSADLTALKCVIDDCAPHLREDAIVVIKSTVPVGTNTYMYNRLSDLTGRDVDCASNPEFLKEGAAIDDFTKPDRVVVGVRRPEVAEVLNELYAPFLRTEKPFLVMSPESSEMTKYAANAMLATKISFINEIANLCEGMDADVNDVRRGIGFDSRIGFAFLFPGVGYGGSCFPKDVRALASMARQHGVEPRILDVVDEANVYQKTVLLSKIKSHFDNQLDGKTIAVWGLAFKPRTDDIREAPALALIDQLLELGAKIKAHDPEAMDNVRREYGDRIEYTEKPMAALIEADALVIMTEWQEFRSPDFVAMQHLMASPVIFDGRNLYQHSEIKRHGFAYHSIGRPSVVPARA